jgi:hypothetical protein
MLARPDTPGVYIHPVDAGQGLVAATRTDIAGFAGIAERGPIGLPVTVRSMRQFESVFGGYIGGGYLAYAVRGFFENGGIQCRVCRVAAAEATAASASIRLADGRFGSTIRASSAGTWGNALTVTITPSRQADTIATGAESARTCRVASTQGFDRLALVRISQDGIELWRIVAAVDPARSSLHWTHPEPGLRAEWEEPLAGIDLGRPFRIERIDYDLTFRERGRLAGVFGALSPVPGAPRHAAAILRLPRALSSTTVDSQLDQNLAAAPPPGLVDIEDGTSPDWAAVPVIAPEGATLSLGGGVDGLTLLAPEDYVRHGLAPLEAARDVAILACPDIHIQPVRVERETLPQPGIDPCEPCVTPAAPAPTFAWPEAELPPVFTPAQIYRVQAEMIEQCERLRDRVALIDPPYATASKSALGPGPVRNWRSRFDSAFGVLAFPWLQAPDPLRRNRTRAVPPSGHIAGQYAAGDLASGYPRAVADEPFAWALAATADVSAPVHGLLNSEGINVMAARSGRSLRNLGARAMSSDPTWRFASTRRLVSMLRDALDVATQWAAFEPNDDRTRLLLSENISAFLDRLWRQGALAGPVAEHAYAVRCDESNNSANSRADGRLHVDIAIAPCAPLEFIVLRIGRQANAFELTEETARGSAYIGGAA